MANSKNVHDTFVPDEMVIADEDNTLNVMSISNSQELVSHAGFVKGFDQIKQKLEEKGIEWLDGNTGYASKAGLNPAGALVDDTVAFVSIRMDRAEADKLKTLKMDLVAGSGSSNLRSILETPPTVLDSKLDL